MASLRVGCFAPATGTWAPLPAAASRACRRRPSAHGYGDGSHRLLPLWLTTAGICCSRAAAHAHATRRRLRKLSRRVLQPYAIEPINPFMSEMRATARGLAKRGTGMLDTSEPPEELERLLVLAGADGGAESRRAWRELLYATEGLARFCSCVILEEEALQQKTGDGRSFVELLQEQGVIVGIRADTGFYPLNGYGEKGTDGYADLDQRCQEYYRRGIRLAKWRLEVCCSMELPTDVAVWENSTQVGEAASVCQASGLAFAAEVAFTSGPGNHSLDRTSYVAEKVYSQVVRMMNECDASVEAAALITGVFGAGPEAGPVRLEDSTEYTARSLRRTAPPALAGVHMLPGKLNAETAARSLRALQEAATGSPWVPLPVYSASLLQPVLASWARDGDVEGARSKLLRLLEASSQSQLGMLEEDTLERAAE